MRAARPTFAILMLAALAACRPAAESSANTGTEAPPREGRVRISGDEIKAALLRGGSPAKPDELRERFESLLREQSKGKDASKLRFVVE